MGSSETDIMRIWTINLAAIGGSTLRRFAAKRVTVPLFPRDGLAGCTTLDAIPRLTQRLRSRQSGCCCTRRTLRERTRRIYPQTMDRTHLRLGRDCGISRGTHTLPMPTRTQRKICRESVSEKNMEFTT